MENAVINLYRNMDIKLIDFAHDAVGFIPDTSMLPVFPDLPGRDPVAYGICLEPLSETHHAKYKAEGKELMKEIDALPCEEAVCVVLKEHYRDYLNEQLYYLDEIYRNPGLLLEALVTSLNNYCVQVHWEDGIRCAIICGKFEKLPVYLDSLYETAVAAGSVSSLAEYTGPLIRFIETAVKKADELISGDFSERFLSSAGKALSGCRELLEKCRSAESENSFTPVSPEDYPSLLMRRFGVSFDEINADCDEWLSECSEEMVSIARRLSVDEEKPQSVAEAKAFMDRHAGVCADEKEMFRRAEEYNKLMHDAAADMIWLPDEKCIICGQDELLSSFMDLPIGAFFETGLIKKPITSKYIINQNRWSIMTDGYLKMMSAHECYFGHHTQFLYANSTGLPYTVRMGAKSTALIEGTATYGEELAVPFYGDPYYELFAAYRRNMTVARMKADIMALSEGVVSEEISCFYQEKAGMEKDFADGYAGAHLMMPGYMTTYYMGYRKIKELEKIYGMDKGRYLQDIFSAGGISLESFERYMSLPDEEKAAFRIWKDGD